MVEAPGTAPGSALLISQYVYRHSWKSSIFIIGVLALVLKNSFVFDAFSVNPSIEEVLFFVLVLLVSRNYPLAQGDITMSF